MMKKLIAMLLALLIALSVLPAQVVLAEASVKTVISGVSSSITASYQNELTRTVTVSPSNGGRIVRLQKYSSKTGEFKTVKSYETKDADSASVKITFPKEWRRRRTGQWRVLVPATKQAKKAVKNIRLTSINISNVPLSAKSACVYCIDDGTLVYGKKLHKRLKQASTTKIMTATLLIENGMVNENTKISKHAAETPHAKLYMKVGDIYSNKSLLYALMLPSSNDAAVAIAESVSGSEKSFVKAMNMRAKELNLVDTHFKNPHGLDKDKHYSSAYDLTMLMSNIYPKSRIFRKVVNTKKYTFTTKKYKIKKSVETTNKLNGYSKKHKGGKTGHTHGAGYCFCSVYVHNGKTYVATVLGSSSDEKRWSDTKRLYSYIDKYADSSY